MIKDIVVNVSKDDSTVFYAVSVAAALQAHLTGVAFIYDPVVPMPDGGYIPADVIERQRADNEAAAESAKELHHREQPRRNFSRTSEVEC